MPLRASIIVSTYNNPQALSLVLAGFARQSMHDFEMVVADDGSKFDTADLVRDFAASAPFAVRHVWHEDNGFRKCAILNRAVLESTGDYLIFYDGDCIPSPGSVAVHVNAARKGTTLGVGKIDLEQSFAKTLTSATIAAGVLDGLPRGWWRSRRGRRLLLTRVPGLGRLIDHLTVRHHYWPGENASIFSEDLHRLRGFDERYTYGYEDWDFGYRLQAAGIRTRSVKCAAPLFHLPHARPYRNAEEIERNRQLFLSVLASGEIETPAGLPKGAISCK